MKDERGAETKTELEKGEKRKDVKSLLRHLHHNWKILSYLYEAQKDVSNSKDLSRSLLDETYVHAIANKVGEKPSNISKRLKELRKAGLVEIVEEVGKRKVHRLSQKGYKLVEMIKALAGTEERLPKPPVNQYKLLMGYLLEEDKGPGKRLSEEDRERLRRMVWEDFMGICEHTPIWEIDRFWDDTTGRMEKLLQRMRAKEGDVREERSELLGWLGVLTTVLRKMESYSVAVGEKRKRVEESVKRVLRMGFERTDGDLVERCVEVLGRILSEDERVVLFKEYIWKVVERCEKGGMRGEEELVKLRERGVFEAVCRLLPMGEGVDDKIFSFFYGEVLVGKGGRRASMECREKIYRAYKSARWELVSRWSGYRGEGGGK